MNFESWNFDFAGIFRRPTRPTTPAGWVVLAWAAILLLAGFGAAALYDAWRMPVVEAADAALLRGGAYKAFGFAAGIFVAKWTAQRIFSD